MGSAYLSATSRLELTVTASRRRDRQISVLVQPVQGAEVTIVRDRRVAVFDDAVSGSEADLYRGLLELAEGQRAVPLKVAGEAIAAPEGEPLDAECEHFLNACERAPPAYDGLEAVRVLRCWTWPSVAWSGRRIGDLGGMPPRDFYATRARSSTARPRSAPARILAV
jgi:hypothetical protein